MATDNKAIQNNLLRNEVCLHAFSIAVLGCVKDVLLQLLQEEITYMK